MPDRSGPPTRPTLLDRIREGSGDLAWEEFFGTYGPLVWTYARRRGCSEATAEDVVGDAMLKIFERRDVFRYDPDRGRFRDWLGTVVRNRVAEIRRRPQERARPVGDEALPEPPAPDPGPDALWEESFEQGILAAALDAVRREVEPRDYLAFELTELEGIAPARAAAAAGITRNAVYKASKRIRGRLRELVGTYGEDGRLTDRLRAALAAAPPPPAARSLTALRARTSCGRES
jgi:RNA polymerase sigma factor (sigma-70 family)